MTKTNAFKEPGLWLLALLSIFSGPSRQTAGSSESQVECILFNEESLTCNWTSQEKLTANYSLYYRFDDADESKEEECPDYLQRDGINTGCRFNSPLEEHCLFLPFWVYIKANHSRTVSEKSMQLISRVQPGAPFNLSIQSHDHNQLWLSWKSPYEYLNCLEHKINYTSQKDDAWTVLKITGMNFSVASVDPDKFYTFYVYSKLRSTCGDSDLWSDPGGPVHWGKEPSVSTAEKVPSVEPWLHILISVCSVCLLVVLLVTLMRMERVRLVLMPAIPNPSKKFEDLFTAYHGNFSEWAGVSKDAVESFKPSYRESVCRVSELFPGGGYLPVSTDAMSKAGGVPGHPADPTPKTNIP